MANFYSDEMSGTLFKNDQKSNPKAPDYRGKVQIAGVEYELAGWKRTAAKSGKTFLSLKVQLPRDRREDTVPTPQNDEDIPF